MMREPEFGCGPRPSRGVAPGLVLAAALLSSACASKLARAPQTFTIDPPPPRAAVPAGATLVLSLRGVEVAPTYAGAPLVYRVGEHGIERDPYASLAAPPSLILTAAIRGYLKDSPVVRDVIAPGEGLPVDAVVEPAATELAGDFSNTAEPAAVLTLQFRVLAPPVGAAAPREVLLKTYTRRVGLSQRTAAAVVAAWNKALGEIMADFLADLKATRPARP
jgi:ABC-type uncharacterized transport system auxiliary subunit